MGDMIKKILLLLWKNEYFECKYLLESRERESDACVWIYLLAENMRG
jgi:hypothetical protein